MPESAADNFSAAEFIPELRVLVFYQYYILSHTV
jgi:hypothetical protein